MEKLKFASQYQSNKQYPWPSENIDQELKNGPDYYTSCCNAILSRFFLNKCAIPYDVWGERRPFSELRAYRRGKNNPNKYKNLLIGLNKDGSRAKTTINISWDILQILPQKIDAVKGNLQKINYDVDISAIDYQSLVDKKTMVSMATILADPRIAEMKAQIHQAAGRQVIPNQQPSQMPGGAQFSSPEQVNVAAQVGIFYLEEEAALQNLLSKTQQESGSDGISDLVKDDLATLGYSGKRVYTNKNTNMVMEDWVDVDHAIWPHSVYDDYRDISYAAEVKKYPISRLLDETNITEAEAIKIARAYSTNNGVAVTSNWYGQIYSARQDVQFGMNMWHLIEVDVIEAKWIGKKIVNQTSITRKDGKIALNIVAGDYKLSDADAKKGKKLDTYSNQTVYTAKMVLGTGFAFDYGEDNDISYTKNAAGKMCPMIPYRFVRTGSSSLVERCIGFVDDACLANYKMRVARMKMPAPPNVQIDRSALEGMQIDGVRYKPAQLIKLLSDEGFLITDSKNQWGNQQNSSRAVTPIGTDLMDVIRGWWEDMGKSIEMIEKVTGINDVFAAQTPQRQTGLGVSNLLVQGAENALTPLIKANEYITEQPWRIAAKKWQIVATNMSPEQRKNLSINRSLQMVAIGSKMGERDFDLVIKAVDSQQETQQLLIDLQNMQSAQRQGGASSGMNEADFLVCQELIKSGKLKQAQLYMAFAIDKKNEQAQEEAAAAIQQNGQQQQQSAQVKGQIDAQNIQVQGQVDGQLQQAKVQQQLQGQIQLEIVKQQGIRQQMVLANELGINKKNA